MTKTGDAVSPVIATILLVAITVTLVAIISAVTMGMAGGFGNGIRDVDILVKSYNDSGGRGVMVTILDGNDADALRNLSVYIDGSEDPTSPFPGAGTPKVGTPYRFKIDGGGQKITGKVTVTGEFDDGGRVVLAQRDLTFAGT
jgi:flagellin-like protein